jgi:hypothetical protein
VPENEPAKLWGETPLDVGDCRHWQIGPLNLWIRRTPAEWQVATEYADDEALVVAAAAQPPADAECTRWATDPMASSVKLTPVMPDRPLVVEPQRAFRILQHGSARIYISIPVWVRIELTGGAEAVLLTEVPTVILSNTWFGTLFQGELCYWLETTARRTAEDRVGRPHIAMAPMTVVNAAGEELPLEQLCLRTANLGCHLDGRGLWTSSVKVTSTGPDEPQRLEVSPGAPEEARDAQRVSEPREKVRGNLLVRTVGLLHSLPGRHAAGK